MPAPRDVHRTTTQVMAAIMVVIGIVLLVRTLAEGGGIGSLGVILGVLFLAAGAGRFALARRAR
jgi:hypothetical protein